jgi:hypothetical protein
MRARTGILLVLLALGLSVTSHWLLDAGETWIPLIATAWTLVAGVALAGLLWLYVQIARGPEIAIPERAAARLERSMRRASGLLSGGKRRRLARRARALARRIEPESEARKVLRRRLRLANAVLTLITVLSFSFWIFAALLPRLFPGEPFFTDQGAPDAYLAALYSVDQITRGTMFDLFDVFHWSFSGLENDPSNSVFSSIIVTYRLLVGGALVAALAVRLGMREGWRERAIREAAEATKARLESLAAAR